MTDLRQKLEQLGLSQYLEVFVTEGFDTWETVLDIRESDLDSLNVKLGHRRKLQRAIAETRGIPLERLERAVPNLPGAPSVDGSYRSDDSASETRSLNHHKRAEPPSGNTGGTTKRKYRRHPKVIILAISRNLRLTATVAGRECARTASISLRDLLKSYALGLRRLLAPISLTWTQRQENH
ncbi:hypothetical protein SLS58_004855 [Diplodia intermedia]|uniref:SAM domain-containing protein n=1 Tax=Diplodia intermedia TaxID=856260 RepID=A0ABR3TSD6_9PEZI